MVFTFSFLLTLIIRVYVLILVVAFGNNLLVSVFLTQHSIDCIESLLEATIGPFLTVLLLCRGFNRGC